MEKLVEIVHHKTAEEFLGRVAPLLDKAQAENNLIWGLASEMVRWPKSHAGSPVWLSIERQDVAVAAALMSPPRKLIVTRLPDDSAERLADHLHRLDVSLPGAVGPSPDTQRFVRRWVELRDATCRLYMDQIVYQCERVEWGNSAVGRLREANADDLPRLVPWYEQFFRDIGLDRAQLDGTHTTESILREQIDRGRLFVWENGQVTSMAAWARQVARGVAVNLVYTPPEFRRKGYATACVAAMTGRLLDSGHRRCFLHADLQNSTSNGIYQKIGYRGVCEFEDWSFGNSEL